MIRKQHRITVVALVLVTAALFATSASARPIDEVGPASDPAPPSTAPAEVQVVRVPSGAQGGFDWGDAGMGAGATFALTMIGVGGALVVTSRRHRKRTERAAA